jgi:hypothetical protein
VLERFDLSLTEAGVFFFWTGVLSAFAFPVAAWLSRRGRAQQHHGVHPHTFEHRADAGGIRAHLSLVLMLLTIHAALSQMDVPTRCSYVVAVVTEAERAAAASFTSVPRSLAAAASPALAGALFEAS